MVNVYLNGKAIKYEDWYMFEIGDKLYLTIIYPSGKKFTRPFEEWKVEPTIKRAEKLLFNKEERTYIEIETVIEVGNKYFLVTYPSNEKVFLIKRNQAELLEMADMSQVELFKYFEDIGRERLNNAKCEKDEKIAKSVCLQFEQILLKQETALSAYLTGKVKSYEEELSLIYPFGINETQMEAVKNAFKSQISIIEGPPGTGKTQTILNIVANVIIRGKTCAVISNNNSAVENVYEKLEKQQLDFMVAKLGREENREAFFVNKNYQTPKAIEFVEEQEIDELFGKVEKYLHAKNELARLQNEIQEIKIEKRYLEKWLSQNPQINAKYVEKYNLDHIKTVEMFAYLKQIEDKTLTLKDKWNLLYRFKMFRSKFLNDIKNREDFIFSLQLTFYEKILNEKSEKKSEIEKLLLDIDYDKNLGKLKEKSLQFLYQYVYNNMPKKMPNFTAKDYRKNFDTFVKYYPIIGSSTYSVVRSIGKEYLLDYVIIDEASQQDLVPGILGLACAKNAVIVGDRKQLSHIPTPTNIIAPKELYDCTKYSLLDSVNGVFGESIPRTLLKEHYRCHPKIIQFCNQQFYNGELIPMNVDNGEDALSLIYTALGNHMRNYKNQREIESIMKVNEQYGFLENENTESSIGFIAPYNAQVDLAEKMLPKKIIENTIHKFQGRECDEIIFSTVLDKKRISQNQIDFVDHPALVNVAVSRAKNKFTLVTGKDVFSKNNKYIAALIRYIEYYKTEEAVIDSPVISAFDLLYSEYDKSLEKLAKKLNPNDSKYKSEQIVSALINELLEENEYTNLVSHKQVYLNQVVSNTNTSFTDREKIFMRNRASCDFVLYYHVGKTPLVVIEVDGGYHDKPEQVERDALKNSILAKAKIPLLRLRTTDSEIKEKLKKFIEESMHH